MYPCTSMEEALLKSGENLKLMLETLKLHEQNIAAWYKMNTIENKPDTDVSMEDAMFFVERTYGTLYYPANTSCPLTHKMFKPADPVIQIKTCKHLFDKERFLDWIKFHRHCPRCTPYDSESLSKL